MAVTSSFELKPVGDLPVPEWMALCCFVLLVVHLTFFPSAYMVGAWIYEPEGHGQTVDFVAIWSAGELAWHGPPEIIYDWAVHKQAQIAVLGQAFEGQLGWHYPPTFLFVAKALALFPYGVAFVGWVIVSLALFLVSAHAIIERQFAWIYAAGFPVVFNNTMVGQTGFLSAALIGGTLVLIPRRPILAGVCLGLLTYKPQFGLLFPLLLIAAGQWRVFISAAVVAVALAGLAALAFGLASWQAFVEWMPRISQAILSEGRTPWAKMQSIYGVMRYSGFSETLAWVAQGAMIVVVTVGVVAIWRSRVDYSLKAAAVATATLLVTPYVFIYDMVVLGVAIAFLIRIGITDGFLRGERASLLLTFALLISFSFTGIATGLAATLVIAGVIIRRCWLQYSASAELTPSVA